MPPTDPPIDRTPAPGTLHDWPGAYDELRRLATRLLARERRNHTLQPTALVHEAFLRFARDPRYSDADRARILSCAAWVMRDVLVDHARRKRARKRGGGKAPATLDETLIAFEERTLDLLVFEEALDRLAARDAQLARLVELRFFGGLSEQETAEVLGVATRTVRRGWSVARQWLARELEAELE